MNAQAAIQLPQPKADPSAFLIENWKSIMASASREEHQVVRVLSGVANLTNGTLVVRTPVPLPDGFYLINNQNNLFPHQPYGWLSFPDFETVRPPFEKMQPLCQIPQAWASHLVPFCSEARMVKADLIIDRENIYWRQNPAQCIKFPFNIKRDEVIVDPTHLKMVLLEVLRYDSVYLYQEERIDRATTPLVFGLDWSRCVLLRTQHPWHHR